MRALAKVGIPSVLRDNEAVWTRAYVSATSAKERSGLEKWRHPDIKRSLRAETKSKCAYCEASMEDVSFSHVEHLRPKSKFPALAHTWDNLTTACGVCNVAKADYFIEGNECLNPYIDELSNFINPVGPWIDWVAGNSRAEITVKKIQLNRSNLVVARADRLSKIRDLYERWHESPEPIRSILEDTLRLDAMEGEFTQTVAVFLRSKNFPI